MSQIDMREYRDIYVQTARDNIKRMFSNLPKLMENSSNKESIDEIHINAHSLRSKSQVMGYANVAQMCANIERMSNDILNGVGQADEGFITFLKDSIDKISSRLTVIEKGDAEINSA